jgi:hypothetical protein
LSISSPWSDQAVPLPAATRLPRFWQYHTWCKILSCSPDQEARAIEDSWVIEPANARRGMALRVGDWADDLRSGQIPARVAQHWWSPEKPPQLVGNGLQFDLRVMHADLGLAWLGQWGYLGALMWLPWASVRVWRATRAGRRASPSERILFVTLCVLLVAISGLVHFTPLRYPTFNFFVI